MKYRIRLELSTGDEKQLVVDTLDPEKLGRWLAANAPELDLNEVNRLCGNATIRIWQR
ncbi:MAG: hypothetical protein ACYCVZ_19395 [Streptosporangiaceae bacterium]